MFIQEAVRQATYGINRPLRILDSCAAPGGKTTAMIDALPSDSMIVANEYDAKRCAVLRENLAKWGYPYYTITQGDTARFRDYPEIFDLILADVPCSGEGMMRKDSRAIEQWSENLVNQCEARQREILRNLWPSLRPGGVLIYSTCTFNTRENEQIVSWLSSELGAVPLELETPYGSKILPPTPPYTSGLHFVPGITRGEGLFMAALRKPGTSPIENCSEKGVINDKARKNKKQRPHAKADIFPPEVNEWIDSKYPVSFRSDYEKITATIHHPLALPGLTPTLDIAYVKGKNLIPTQQLALSRLLSQSAFQKTEVSKETAIKYLRHESVSLPGSIHRGIILLTYEGFPLGFVKNIGAHANNLYPKAWRILSDIS